MGHVNTSANIDALMWEKWKQIVQEARGGYVMWTPINSSVIIYVDQIITDTRSLVDKDREALNKILREIATVIGVGVDEDDDE